MNSYRIPINWNPNMLRNNLFGDVVIIHGFGVRGDNVGGRSHPVGKVHHDLFRNKSLPGRMTFWLSRNNRLAITHGKCFTVKVVVRV